MLSIVAFLVSILPSIFIIGIIFNQIINLLMSVKLLEDDLGAGVLLIIFVISYGTRIVISHILNVTTKGLSVYKISKKS